MSPRVFGLLDMAVVGVPVVTIIAWQLIAIHREIQRDAKAKAADDSAVEKSDYTVSIPLRYLTRLPRGHHIFASDRFHFCTNAVAHARPRAGVIP